MFDFRYGDALQHAAPSCRADMGVVLEAVKNDGNALEWASEDLQDDKDVVLQAVRGGYINIIILGNVAN